MRPTPSSADPSGSSTLLPREHPPARGVESRICCQTAPVHRRALTSPAAVAAVLSVLALALAACGTDDGPSDETIAPLITTTTSTTTAPVVTTPPATVAPTAVPTTVAASTTTSTTVAATTTTSIPKAAVLVLRDDGLGDALFGTDPDQVIAYVSANLGKPTADSGWADPFSAFGVCPGTEVRGVTWGDLTLLFSDDSPIVSGRRHFFSYLLGPPFGATVQPAGMTTAERIGVGNTVGELRFTYPDVELFDDELAGPSFVLSNGINGAMTGTADDELVTFVSAGPRCGE